uniref:Uncharacterized protein n=1 Tax=Arundo donax TaxID=35708 RepID=A0A0A9A4P7_ARUDO
MRRDGLPDPEALSLLRRRSDPIPTQPPNRGSRLPKPRERAPIDRVDLSLPIHFSDLF